MTQTCKTRGMCPLAVITDPTLFVQQAYHF